MCNGVYKEYIGLYKVRAWGFLGLYRCIQLVGLYRVV